jgi:K+-transporting ATPase ATPase B chain
MNSSTVNAMSTTKHAQPKPLFDAQIVRGATLASLKKLDPRAQIRNPVMFVVWVCAVLTSVLTIQAIVGEGEAPWTFILAISLWLWATLIFANFA